MPWNSAGPGFLGGKKSTWPPRSMNACNPLRRVGIGQWGLPEQECNLLPLDGPQRLHGDDLGRALSPSDRVQSPRRAGAAGPPGGPRPRRSRAEAPARRRRTSRHCRPGSHRPELIPCPIPAHGFAPAVCGDPSARMSDRSSRWSARTGPHRSRSERGSIPALRTLLRDSAEARPGARPPRLPAGGGRRSRARPGCRARSGDRPGGGSGRPARIPESRRAGSASGRSRRSSHSPGGRSRSRSPSAPTCSPGCSRARPAAWRASRMKH